MGTHSRRYPSVDVMTWANSLCNSSRCAGDQPGYWSNPVCDLQRGWFERGMLCAIPVADVVWTNRPPECSNTTAPICSPVLEYIDIELVTATLGASIYYRVDTPDGPASAVVTPPTSLAESVPTAGSVLLGPSGIIQLELVRQGCNIFPISNRIRVVAVLRGQPNSDEVDLGPEFQISPLGYWPPPVANKTTIPYCPVAEWLPDPLSAKVPPPWLPTSPAKSFGGCVAYRYLTFQPTALFSSETDAWALKALEFYFR